MLKPGYNDAGGVYGLQSSGARGGTEFAHFIYFLSFVFVLYIQLLMSFFCFAAFQLHFRRWVFSVQAMLNSCWKWFKLEEVYMVVHGKNLNIWKANLSLSPFSLINARLLQCSWNLALYIFAALYFVHLVDWLRIFVHIFLSFFFPVWLWWFMGRGLPLFDIIWVV